LFNLYYFDYAVSSPFPEGFLSKLDRYSAYPQPGRAFLLKLGARFDAGAQKSAMIYK
jgi:iron complex outermembrane receptor protein